MLIRKEIAQELTYANVPIEGFTVVERKIVDHRRWSVQSRLVVEKDGRFYASTYFKGATEQQDESPYECAPAEIEFPEVTRKEITVVVYE